MKFNKKELKEFILSEARKIAVENNWIKPEEEIQFETVMPESKKDEKAATEEYKEETKEAIKLAEEFKRMKQLLDFRNPLLG